jgi:predicted GIY-YIG superfamily endonuclease
VNAYEGLPGFVYLLHYERPFLLKGFETPAQHYLGWSQDVGRRLREHARGRGSAVTRYAHAQGVGFELVKVWPGTLDTERELRDLGPGRLCPKCGWPARLRDVT